MKWDKIKLGECCEKIGSGSTPKGGGKVYVENGTALIRSQNIYNLRFDYEGLVYINDETAQKLNGVTVKENDVLINITGDSVARTCVVPRDVLPARVNQHVSIIRPNNNILQTKFLNYYLASPSMQALMLGLAVGKGASRNAMTKNMISEFEIPCPPIAIQQKIASILSAYDDLIDNNRRQIKLLEEAAQRLYKEWFVDLRFPGHEDVKIIDGVPEGWKKVFLADIADVVMGQSPKSEFYNHVNNGLPFHQGVGSYGERFVKNSTYSTSYTKIATSGSILFSVRAPVGRLNLTKDKIVIGRGLSAINHKEGMQSYLFYLLKKKFFRDNLVGNGSIFASISKDELLRQTLTIATDNIIEKFNDIASVFDKKIEILDEQIKFLSEARDRLLPKLMSGEISLEEMKS